MIACMIIAALIAIFSIFAFFGPAFSNTGGVIVPNMFHLMFGATQSVLGYEVRWKMYTGLLILFIIQVFIILIATYVLYIASRIYKKTLKASYGVGSLSLLGFFSLPAIIISFLTLKIVGDDAASSVRLGAGPIIYSVLHIVVVVLGVIGISLKNYHPMNGDAVEEDAYDDHLDNPQPEPQQSFMSENERADLILKYKKMLDDDVITQEEFEKKKKELLG